MTNERYEPTKAQFLADMVIGNASLSGEGSTIQRSHRFPLHLFIQIENMARVAGAPVSVIINQLIECGLEAVAKELPENVVTQLHTATKDQLDRPSSIERTEVKGRNLAAQNKPKKGSKRS